MELTGAICCDNENNMIGNHTSTRSRTKAGCCDEKRVLMTSSPCCGLSKAPSVRSVCYLLLFKAVTWSEKL